MPLRIASFVEESKVPLVRRGGPGNPEIAEVTAQLIEAAESGNTQFAFIPIEDKLERKRTGESIRNQARSRGWSIEKVSGSRTRKIKGGTTSTEMGLYIRAYQAPTEEVMTETPKRRRNGGE